MSTGQRCRVRLVMPLCIAHRSGTCIGKVFLAWKRWMRSVFQVCCLLCVLPLIRFFEASLHSFQISKNGHVNTGPQPRHLAANTTHPKPSSASHHAAHVPVPYTQSTSLSTTHPRPLFASLFPFPPFPSHVTIHASLPSPPLLHLLPPLRHVRPLHLPALPRRLLLLPRRRSRPSPFPRSPNPLRRRPSLHVSRALSLPHL